MGSPTSFPSWPSSAAPFTSVPGEWDEPYVDLAEKFPVQGPTGDVIRGGLRSLSGIMTPRNATILAGAIAAPGVVPAQALGAYFSADMLANLGPEFQGLSDAYKAGDWRKLRELGGQTFLNALMTVGGMKHTMAPRSTGGAMGVAPKRALIEEPPGAKAGTVDWSPQGEILGPEWYSARNRPMNKAGHVLDELQTDAGVLKHHWDPGTGAQWLNLPKEAMAAYDLKPLGFGGVQGTIDQIMEPKSQSPEFLRRMLDQTKEAVLADHPKADSMMQISQWVMDKLDDLRKAGEGEIIMGQEGSYNHELNHFLAARLDPVKGELFPGSMEMVDFIKRTSGDPTFSKLSDPDLYIKDYQHEWMPPAERSALKAEIARRRALNDSINNYFYNSPAYRRHAARSIKVEPNAFLSEGEAGARKLGLTDQEAGRVVYALYDYVTNHPRFADKPIREYWGKSLSNTAKESMYKAFEENSNPLEGTPWDTGP